MKYIARRRSTLIIWSLFAVGSLGLIWGAWRGVLPMSLTEVFGFISGVLTVWLVVKENIWNWPIGILNSASFVILFWNSRLFADMGLQVIYIILGFLGWYWWLKGGAGRTALTISRTGLATWGALIGLSIVMTYAATRYLRSVNDSAPFLDALTTVMSLVAQYLLTKKKVENWFIWIAVDVIYIGLYAYKELYLTSGLYVLFMLMCMAGWRSWRKTVTTVKPIPAAAEGVVAHG